MDPQLRLMLEVSYEAIVDGGEEEDLGLDIADVCQVQMPWLENLHLAYCLFLLVCFVDLFRHKPPDDAWL